MIRLETFVVGKKAENSSSIDFGGVEFYNQITRSNFPSPDFSVLCLVGVKFSSINHDLWVVGRLRQLNIQILVM